MKSAENDSNILTKVIGGELHEKHIKKMILRSPNDCQDLGIFEDQRKGIKGDVLSSNIKFWFFMSWDVGRSKKGVKSVWYHNWRRQVTVGVESWKYMWQLGQRVGSVLKSSNVICKSLDEASER